MQTLTAPKQDELDEIQTKLARACSAYFAAATHAMAVQRLRELMMVASEAIAIHSDPTTPQAI